MSIEGFIYTDPTVREVSSTGAIQPLMTKTFYVTGTTTLATVYSNATLATTRANPVVATGSGAFPTVYLDPAVAYRVVTKNAAGVTLTDIDPGAFVPTPDGSIIGPAIYPRTTQEIAASITPTSYLYPYGNIKRYGGNGDGTTSNNTALGTALTLMSSAGGGTIYFPAGTYAVTGTYSPASGTEFLGDGYTSSKLVWATNHNGLRFPSTGGYSAIRKMAIQGTGKTSEGIKIGDTAHCGHFIFEDCYISGWATGVRLAAALWTTFDRCIITLNTYGIDFYAGSGSMYSTTVTIHECAIASNDKNGIWAQSVPFGNTTIALIGGSVESNCLADPTLPQVSFGTVAGNGVHGLVVDGVYFEDGSATIDALDLRGCESFRVSNCSFNGGDDCIKDSVGGAAGSGVIFGNFATGQAAKFINMASEVDIVEFTNSFSGTITLTGTACRSLSALGVASWGNDQTTMVPVLTGTGGGPATYTTQLGQYTRVGNQVSFILSIVITSKGAMTGPISITGMPKISQSNVAVHTVFPAYCSGITPSGSNNCFVAVLAAGATTLQLYGTGTATPAQVDGAAVANATTIYVSGTYQCAA